MTMDWYILDEDKKPVKIDIFQVPVDFWSEERRRVGITDYDDVRISTVFLGLDHSWGEGRPIVFETMVFGGECDGEQERYCTWEEAVEGHEAMVNKVKLAHEKKEQ